MRSILVLTSTYPRWAQDTEPAFVHFLCRQLSRTCRVIVLAPHYPGARRHEEMDGVHVCRFRYFIPMAERLAYDGGIITNLKRNRLKFLLIPFFLTSQFVNILWLARKYRVDLIHAHWIVPQGLLAVLARRLRLIPGRIRVLCTAHGGDLFSLQRNAWQALKYYTLRHADHTTVVSTAMRDLLVEAGCSAGRISVRSMGVDLSTAFQPDTVDERNIDLLFVGRLVEKKGVAVLVEALHLLQAEFPDLRLTIVGDGPDKTALQQRAGQLGIADRIDFTGAVPNDEVPRYYRSARIAVVPSVVSADGDQEGLGLVAVEALGCGCATIVSDLPALRDVVTHDDNGLVFRAGDAADLAGRIRTLLTDDGLRARLAARSRPSVVDRFDWQTVGAGYGTLIDRLLAVNPGR